ncbi:MAG: Asp-tRNA(Asn)/Glu-tRNA(Gln) amidotransferase subunit GatC [Actinobacteria bacterium]|nr:Asp-tRNA(Asn)/Glu-tRNA(Gln) amidotransferase subunit GatC [Actinomycetota bacterium]
MSEHLSTSDVRKIAEYSRIGLDDMSVEQMTVDLNEIIDSLAPITAFDLEGVEPTFHPIGDLSNVMRDDVPQDGFTREVALSNTDSTENGMFRIPTILGGGDA